MFIAILGCNKSNLDVILNLYPFDLSPCTYLGTSKCIQFHILKGDNNSYYIYYRE